jgi:hypothetical protein
MRTLVTAAVVAASFVMAGCATRAVVVAPAPVAVVAPAPVVVARPVVAAPVVAVPVTRVCRFRNQRVMTAGGVMVVRRVRVCR